MPKARSAILSSLRGSLRGGPTFRATSQTPDIVMQQRPVPTDRRTAKQAAVRNAYSRLAYLWKNLSYLDKEPYQIMAEARNLTPWNCWLSFHLPLMRLSPTFYTSFAEGSGTTVENFAIGGTPGNNIDSNWTAQNNFPGMSFNDSTSMILYPEIPPIELHNNFTIYLIYNLIEIPEYAIFLSSVDNYPDYDSYFELGYYIDSFYIDSYGENNKTLESYAVIPYSLNKIHSFALTYDKNNFKFYSDGEVFLGNLRSTEGIFTALNLSVGNWILGKYAQQGNIFLTAVIPGTLAAAQVAALDAHYKPFFT